MTTTRQLDDTHDPARPTVSYEIEVAGHLDDHWSDWLGGHPLVRTNDGSTAITVHATDQAQLHGVLTGIRDLGADLLGLHVQEPTPAPHVLASTLGHTLRTERLTLRTATVDDAEATWAYRRLDSVNEWLTGGPETFEEYRTLFAEPSRLADTVIVELNDDLGGDLIGDFMLRRDDAWAQAEVVDQARGAQVELGWVLDPAHTGAGYATEAVRALLRHCFDDLGVHRVVANCFLDNETSWRLMERIGMRRETHAVRESLHRSGRWLDTLGYAILREELPRAPAGDAGDQMTPGTRPATR